MSRSKKTDVPFHDRIKDFRRVDASDLVPNPKNWRTHNDRQRAAYRGLVGAARSSSLAILSSSPLEIRAEICETRT